MKKLEITNLIKSNYLKLALVLFFTFLLIPFYKDLGKENVNVDQFKWYARSENFFENFHKGDFYNTYQQYHPGISLIYLVRLGQVSFNYFQNNNLTLKEISFDYAADYNFYTKFYLVTFILILIFSGTYILSKITKNIFISILFLFLILTEPYFIGNVRNLHMDSLISLIIFNSLLYFYYWIISGSKKYILLSGIFFGLGLLTKSIVISAFIYILGICFLLNFYNKNLKYLKNFFVVFFVSFITFFILFPAMWVAPIDTLTNVYYNGVYRVAISGDENFTHIVNNVGTKDPGLSFYLLVLKFRLSVVHQISIILVFACLIFIGIKKLDYRKIIVKDSLSLLVIYLFTYSLLFYIGLNISEKKTDRYLMVIYPCLIAVTSIIIIKIYALLKSKFYKKILIGILVLFSAFNLTILYLIHPYYFAFYNPIYGGIQKARTQVYLNPGGIGAFEVAKYLNSKNLAPEDLIGTSQRTEFAFFSKHPVIGLEYSKMKNYRYVLLTLQVGQNFRGSRKLEYGIEILGSPYLRLYGN